ncbi:YxiJ family protein [Bacillus sp. SW14]|uniref:YxiJ family protein n=1 Tax=Bacillus sp. SW14 TaxID=3391618 RepID=UPI0039E47AD7
MFEKLRKRQQELEEKPYPDELYGFEAEIYEFFMLVAGSLDYVLANKRMPRHQRRSLEKSFFELYPEISPDMIKNDTDLYHYIFFYEQVRQEICFALATEENSMEKPL